MKQEFEKLMNLSFIDAVIFDIDGTRTKMCDRNQVVKMFRESGFRVLQVADGNF